MGFARPPENIWVASVMVVEVMCGREGNDPQTNHEGADGENPAARRTVMGGEGGGLTGTEDLAADTDGHQESAED
jgi:hypothetical protein